MPRGFSSRKPASDADVLRVLEAAAEQARSKEASRRPRIRVDIHHCDDDELRALAEEPVQRPAPQPSTTSGAGTSSTRSNRVRPAMYLPTFVEISNAFAQHTHNSCLNHASHHDLQESVTYAEKLGQRELNWRAKLPESVLVAETLSLRLQHSHSALQAQRLSAKTELIRLYAAEPLHCPHRSAASTGEHLQLVCPCISDCAWHCSTKSSRGSKWWYPCLSDTYICSLCALTAQILRINLSLALELPSSHSVCAMSSTAACSHVALWRSHASGAVPVTGPSRCLLWQLVATGMRLYSLPSGSTWRTSTCCTISR